MRKENMTRFVLDVARKRNILPFQLERDIRKIPENYLMRRFGNRATKKTYSGGLVDILVSRKNGEPYRYRFLNGQFQTLIADITHNGVKKHFVLSSRENGFVRELSYQDPVLKADMIDRVETCIGTTKRRKKGFWGALRLNMEKFSTRSIRHVSERVGGRTGISSRKILSWRSILENRTKKITVSMDNSGNLRTTSRYIGHTDMDTIPDHQTFVERSFKWASGDFRKQN